MKLLQTLKQKKISHEIRKVLPDLISEAKTLLERNWPGQSTKPSPHRY